MKTGLRIGIVDGFSSGALMPSAAGSLGYTPFHIQSSSICPPPALRDFNPSHYQGSFVHHGHPHTMTVQSDSVRELAGQLSSLKLDAVVTGSESGVVLADHLSEAMGLRTNGSGLSHARRDKYLMARAVHAAGIPVAKFTAATSVNDVMQWAETKRVNWPIFLKTSTGSGTSCVYACHNRQEVERAFARIYLTVNKYGIKNESVFCQEYLAGTEYEVNTLSVGGRYYLTGIWELGRPMVEGGATVYDYDMLLPCEGNLQRQLAGYAFRALHALGVQHGPGHFEIKMTDEGPKLVEMAARLCGSRLPALEGAATDRDAVTLALQSFADPRSINGMKAGYTVKRHAAIVSLTTRRRGVVMSHDMVPRVQELGAHYHSWFAEEGRVFDPSVDISGLLGEVWLLHEEPNILAETVARVRSWGREEYFVKGRDAESR